MRRGLLAAVAVLAAAVPGAALAAGDPLRGDQWGLSMVESDSAHSVTSGAGAVVAVIDSGVRATHEDLRGRLVAGYDFVGDDADPRDENGHGTHVAGIISASKGNGRGVSSVAPGAKVMPVRVLDAEGSGASADVAAGIDFAVKKGADVINLSLGEDAAFVLGSSSEFSAAIDRALDKGRVVVAAAGNNGTPACDQPGGSGRLLCVGAVDKRRARSLFSNFGSGLGVVAPGGSALPFAGEDILSTYYENDSDYFEIAGTSQAAPHVAGVAALLVSRGYCGRSAVNRILATASDAGSAGPDSEYGAGIVNARRAVAGLRRGTCKPGGSRGRDQAAARGGSSARIAVARRMRIRTALRRGIRVRCRAAGAGRCRVLAKRGRRKVARGSRKLRAGRTVTVRAKVTKPGRRLLRRALRKRKRVKLALRVRLPGSAPLKRRITLRP